MVKLVCILKNVYFIVIFELCIVNTQHFDGIIKLKQGTLIGVISTNIHLVKNTNNSANLIFVISRTIYLTVLFNFFKF